MKRSIFIITTLLLSSLLLVACAKSGTNPEGTPYATQGTNELGTPVTTTLPGGTTPLATEPMGTSVAPGVTETVTTTVGGGSALGNKQPDAGRVSNLIKFDVQDRDGNKLGTVSDLVLNLESDRVQYVIVNMGGVLGVGGKEIAVPSALFDFPAMGMQTPGVLNTPATGLGTPAAGLGTPASGTPAYPASNPSASTTGNNYLIFRADKAALDNAPKWDETILPQLGQPAGDWDSSLSVYWNTYVTPSTVNGVVTNPTPVVGTPVTPSNPAAGTTPAAPGLTLSGKFQGVVLASKVLRLNIADANGKTIAAIKDIIIDTTNWKILYVVIDYTAAGTSGGFYIPIPPAAFSYSTDGKSLTIANADTLLTTAPHFTENDFPFTGTVGWDKDVKTFWDQNIKTKP